MKTTDFQEIKTILDEALDLYHHPSFIAEDPISVPHQYSIRQDIEISGLFSALFAWGKRSTSIRKANELMTLMDNAPYDFIMNSRELDMKRFESFVHRTFQSVDVLFLVNSLKEIYREYNTIEPLFSIGFQTGGIVNAIHHFRQSMLAYPHLPRSGKHLPDPFRGSSAKRVNMFLRWMVRKDKADIDFGLWNSIPQSKLKLPLDVHTGRIARMLGLLTRKSNDWLAVEEVSSSLYQLDPEDPIKYDLALFNLGLHKKS